MIRIVFIIAFAACARPTTRASSSDITQTSCSAGCSSSVECRSALSGCQSCWNGHCSAVLPADPDPGDAGVDAPGGLTIAP